VRLEVALLLEHGRARRRQHAADDHVVLLTADVTPDHRHRAFPPHRSILSEILIRRRPHPRPNTMPATSERLWPAMISWREG